MTGFWFDECLDPIIDLKLADSSLWMFEADLRQARDEALGITTVEQYRYVWRRFLWPGETYQSIEKPDYQLRIGDR